MTVQPPTVSVVIATYNWSSVLRYAIRSVLAQTFRDFELLVVGDACTDDTAEVVAAFGDPRIRWFNLERNSGSQSGPNNFGIEQARGRYIAYLGHDDLWHPDHLERMVATMERDQADLAFSMLVMIGPPESGHRKLFGSGGAVHGTHVPPSGMMHRRELVAEIGRWHDYREIDSPPDFEFLQRGWKLGKRYTAVDALTVFKFPSAWRRNAYIERPFTQQADYLTRMFAEPDFIAHELAAIEAARAAGKDRPPDDVAVPPTPKNAPPGWRVEQFRRIRGLPPGVDPEDAGA